jgi:hypothetical protein
MVQQLFNGYEPNRVYKTDNYKMFSMLAENRNVSIEKVRQLEILIKMHGQQAPISVNEKMEIIDGQHRFLACENLGATVEFMIRPGATAQSALYHNQGGNNWKLKDHIHYYAKTGNEHYKILFDWIEKNPDISAQSIASILRGSLENRWMYFSKNGELTSNHKLKELKGNYPIGSDVQVGLFKIADIHGARRRLYCIRAVLDALPDGKVAKGKVVSALIKIMRIEQFKHDQLVFQIKSYPTKIHPVTSTDDCVKMFDELYNYKRRNDKRVTLYEYDSRRK